MSAVDMEIDGAITFEAEHDDGDFTDADLAVLALAADPDEESDPDAVPLSDFGAERYSPLPAWYMPAPMVRGHNTWRMAIALSVVVSLLLIEALGLCVTYGQLVRA